MVSIELGLKGLVDDPEFYHLVSNHPDLLGIDLVVQHAFEKDAWTVELHALSVKGLEFELWE